MNDNVISIGAVVISIVLVVILLAFASRGMK